MRCVRGGRAVVLAAVAVVAVAACSSGPTAVVSSGSVANGAATSSPAPASAAELAACPVPFRLPTPQDAGDGRRLTPAVQAFTAVVTRDKDKVTGMWWDTGTQTFVVMGPDPAVVEALLVGVADDGFPHRVERAAVAFDGIRAIADRISRAGRAAGTVDRVVSRYDGVAAVHRTDRGREAPGDLARLAGADAAWVCIAS